MTVEYLHRCLGRLSTCHNIFVSSSCVWHCSWRNTWPGLRQWGAHSATHRESLCHYPFAIPSRLLLLACSQQDMTRTRGSASMPPGCSCSAWLVGQALLGQCHSEPSCRRTSDAWQISHALYYKYPVYFVLLLRKVVLSLTIIIWLAVTGVASVCSVLSLFAPFQIKTFNFRILIHNNEFYRQKCSYILYLSR